MGVVSSHLGDMCVCVECVVDSQKRPENMKNQEKAKKHLPGKKPIKWHIKGEYMNNMKQDLRT